MKIPASAAKVMIPHYESGAPIEDLAVVMKLPDGDFLRDGVPCVPANLKGDLVPSLSRHWSNCSELFAAELLAINQIEVSLDTPLALRRSCQVGTCDGISLCRTDLRASKVAHEMPFENKEPDGRAVGPQGWMM